MVESNNYTGLAYNKANTSQKTKEQWLSEGIHHYNNRRYKQALVACEQAIQFDSSFSRAYHGRGLALAKLKRLEEAVNALQRALHLNPQTAKICVDLGQILTTLDVMKSLGLLTGKPSNLIVVMSKPMLIKQRFLLTEQKLI